LDPSVTGVGALDPSVTGVGALDPSVTGVGALDPGVAGVGALDPSVTGVGAASWIYDGPQTLAHILQSVNCHSGRVNCHRTFLQGNQQVRPIPDKVNPFQSMKTFQLFTDSIFQNTRIIGFWFLARWLQ